jgi:RNA-binding protein YhbY
VISQDKCLAEVALQLDDHLLIRVKIVGEELLARSPRSAVNALGSLIVAFRRFEVNRWCHRIGLRSA